MSCLSRASRSTSDAFLRGTMVLTSSSMRNSTCSEDGIGDAGREGVGEHFGGFRALALAGFHLGDPGGGEQGQRAVRLFLKELPVKRGDAGPVLVALKASWWRNPARIGSRRRGCRTKPPSCRLRSQVAGTWRVRRACRRSFSYRCPPAGRYMEPAEASSGCWLEEAGEILDDLVGLVHVLVVEVDEREAVAHVAGVAAVRELGEIFLTGGEGLLVFVGEEIRHRHIIEGVFDQRAVREILEELGENRRGFLEVAVLENAPAPGRRCSGRGSRIWGTWFRGRGRTCRLPASCRSGPALRRRGWRLARRSRRPGYFRR